MSVDSKKHKHVKHFFIRKNVDSATGGDIDEQVEMFSTDGTED